MQTRRIWKLVCQFKRVLDGALGQRAMLEGKDLPVVAFVELCVASAGAAFPKATEAAVGGRSGAMDENQNRLCSVQFADRVQIRCARNSATIESGAWFERAFYLVADDVGDITREIDPEDFEPFDHPGPDAASRAT